MPPLDSGDAGRNPGTRRGDGVGSITCLANVDILLVALEDRRPLDEHEAQHMRSCAYCRGRVADLRRLLGEIAAFSNGTRADDEPCLDEAALAELADGGGAANPPRAHVAHLAGCAHCRHELASLTDLLGDPGVAEEIRGVDAPSLPTTLRRRPLVLRAGAVGTLAAAAVVLFLLWPAGDRFDATRHRAPTITASEAPRLTSPVGDVDGTPAFRWSSVIGSDRYRVTLFDDVGRVMYEAEVIDTVLALPNSVVTVRGRSYLWKVEARTEVGRWTPSELIEFRVGGRRTP